MDPAGTALNCPVFLWPRRLYTRLLISTHGPRRSSLSSRSRFALGGARLSAPIIDHPQAHRRTVTYCGHQTARHPLHPETIFEFGVLSLWGELAIFKKPHHHRASRSTTRPRPTEGVGTRMPRTRPACTRFTTLGSSPAQRTQPSTHSLRTPRMPPEIPAHLRPLHVWVEREEQHAHETVSSSEPHTRKALRSMGTARGERRGAPMPPTPASRSPAPVRPGSLPAPRHRGVRAVRLRACAHSAPHHRDAWHLPPPREADSDSNSAPRPHVRGRSTQVPGCGAQNCRCTSRARIGRRRSRHPRCWLVVRGTQEVDRMWREALGRRI
ncbi:hypothetical protein B0H17DRAFT_1175791 [Mycena rosella]|uniref:Uncharacterized protein n=1 Tax=Mycena rosella TaxID=1033263 RepID=A0AAD7DZV7_MYCRO|nr:hypothetical protein B0H17DRAFT_1175791 [Mycena rosella]